MLAELGLRPYVQGPCLFVGAGVSGEPVSLSSAFEAWWAPIKEKWIGQFAISIRILLGLPLGRELMIGWPRDEIEEVLRGNEAAG
jgi:hypothetical protein